MKLSIVATLYHSEDYITEFYERCKKSAESFVGDDYEILLVNDGSPDNSLHLAVELSNQDNHVVVIDLSRNFGHHKAMMTGLAYSKGEYVFLIDSDLEEEPEYLNGFADQMNTQQVDVVYGVQIRRKGKWFERWSGYVWYKLFNLMADIDHPTNIITMRLMTRRYVDALLQFNENQMVLSCLWVITGFDQLGYPVTKKDKNKTTYTLSKKISNATNAITSFSAAPLKLIFYTGASIFLLSVIYTIFVLYNKIFNKLEMDGWTSLIISIWMLSGIMILFIGIIGIYLSKIFIETKKRPNYIIRKIYGR